MTSDKRLDGTISSWLEQEAPRQLPDRVLRATFERTRTVRQQPRWRAVLGRFGMNRTLYALGGAAAVVALLAIGGVFYLGLNSNRPGIGGQPTPSATASPSPATAPTPSSAVQATAPPAPTLPASDTLLRAGPYSISSGGYRYTINVPSGWYSLVIPGDAQDPTGLFGVQQGDPSNPAGIFSAFSVWGDPSFVYADPCHWTGTAVSTGQTADDFANAMTAVTDLSPTQPTDVTVSGYAGKHFQVSAPPDADFSQCDQGEFDSYQGRYYQGPGQVDDLWILDLEGGDRRLLAYSHMPATAEQSVTQLQQIVDSMVIEPESP